MVKAPLRTTGDLALKVLLTVAVCTVLTAAQSPDGFTIDFSTMTLRLD